MKKILLLSIMIAVLLTSFGFAKSTFPDVAGTKYEDAVTSLNKNGVINGFPDGTFRPQSYVTRAELCKLLVEALDLKQYGNPISSFLDVNYSDWYYEYVKAAVDNGIIIGYNDGTFRPNNNVSYSEMITMLIRAMGEEKHVKNKSDWPNAYITYAKNEGLLVNVSYWDVSMPALRGEVSIALYNMMDLLDEIEDEDDEEDDTLYGFVTSTSKKNNVSYAKIDNKTYTVSSKSDSFTKDTFVVFEKNYKTDEITLVESYSVKDLDGDADIITYASGKTGDQKLKINDNTKYTEYYSSSKNKSYVICVITVSVNSSKAVTMTKHAYKDTIEEIKFGIGDRVVEDTKNKVFLVYQGLDEDDEVSKGKVVETVEYCEITYEWAKGAKVSGVTLPRDTEVEKGDKYTVKVPKDYGDYTFYSTNYSGTITVKKDITIYIDSEYIGDDDDEPYVEPDDEQPFDDTPLIDRLSQLQLEDILQREWYNYMREAFGNDFNDIIIQSMSFRAGSKYNEVKFEVNYKLSPASNEAINRLTIPNGYYDEQSGWVLEKHNVGVLSVDSRNNYDVVNSSVGTGW